LVKVQEAASGSRSGTVAEQAQSRPSRTARAGVVIAEKAKTEKPAECIIGGGPATTARRGAGAEPPRRGLAGQDLVPRRGATRRATPQEVTPIQPERSEPMARHPLAGKAAPAELLVNVPRLLSRYYEVCPDP